MNQKVVTVGMAGKEREVTYEEVRSALSGRKELWLTYEDFKKLRSALFMARDARGLPIPCDDFVDVIYGQSVLEPDVILIRPMMIRVLPDGVVENG
jgi:hypothetical protein